MKNDFRIILDAAYRWDAQPSDFLQFNGRVLNKYGLDYVKMKLSREHLSLDNSIYSKKGSGLTTLLEDSFYKTTQKYENDEDIQDMIVPEDKYDAWLNSLPEKYFSEYAARKYLIDRYLNTFTESDKSRIIKIMCENLDSPNYVQFLDFDPNIMTTQQYLIYKDIISFYDKLKFDELSNNEDLWESYIQRNDAMMDQRLPKHSLNEEYVENDEISERLNQILSKTEETESETVEELKQKIDELNNAAQQAIVNSQNILKQSYNPLESLSNQSKPVQRVNSLVFTPAITTNNQSYVFNNPINYEYKTTYGQISKVGYVNNIQDLINQRNAVAIANNQLVNQIIQNQLAYNNQFQNHSHNISNLQNTSQTIQSIFSINQKNNSSNVVNESGSSLHINQNVSNSQIYKSNMNLNTNAQLNGDIFNSASSNKGYDTLNTNIAKPVLIKINKQQPQNNNNKQTIASNQFRPTSSQSINTQSSIKIPNRSFSNALNNNSSTNSSQFNNEPQSTKIPLTKIPTSPLTVNNLTNNENKQQDIVSVYKVNTKPEPQKVMVGVPSKKID